MTDTNIARSRTPLFGAILLMALLAGCSQQTIREPNRSEAAARAQIDALRTRYEQAVAASDIPALQQVLHQDAIMVFPSGPVHDEIRAAAGRAPLPVGARIAIKPIELEIINEEWAYEFGTSTITYNRPDRDKPIVARDTYLILLRNTGDGWKAFREVASANPPGAEWPSGE